MQYEMPVLTEEQMDQLIEFIRGEQEVWSLEGHYSTVLRIALAALASQTGSAPDGWKLVPIEPTEDMVVEGFESEPDEFFSNAEDWKNFEAMSGCQQAAHNAKLCWQAMLTAAPEHE